MSEGPSTTLVDLARAYGVATDYWDWKGNHTQVSADTIRTVLSVFDVDASTDEAVKAALADRELDGWRRVLPRVVVLREGWTPWVALHAADGAAVEARLVLEDGRAREIKTVERFVEPRTVDGVVTAETTVELPGDLPLGYHELVVSVGAEDGRKTDHRAPVIVTPATLALPKALEDDRVWGLMTQLYTVRSERSWGIGDAADLAELGTWAARQGADFVLINPVHAAEPIATMEPSPYLPTSRRFVNPMYIRVEEVPEIGYLSAAEHQLVEWHSDDARRLNKLAQLDRDGSWEAKRAALRMIFRSERTHRRARDFEQFQVREGQGLIDFATWSAIAIDRGLPWETWPEELRDPRSEAVAAERERLAEEVEFQCWLQWIVQSQLGDAQRELRASGMGVGVVHDLAVGVHPGGADAWALGDVLAHQVSVGAPADDYNQIGQDWSQPPWRPDRLAELGYAPFRDMLRTVLRMAGGIRVDHILGLFRLWWVPRGASPKDGTYVRYDHEAMIGILALEAQRADAVVIGEDLGTVEDWVRDYLLERGLLGTSILWFERKDGVAPRDPETYRSLCLASVTTHDLPPTAGYLQGEHIAVRHELGLLTRPLEEEIAEDDAQREAVLSALRERGLLKGKAKIEDQVDALHKYLAWAPSKMLGVSVNDLVGDVRTINQPGTDEEYPNWRLPLADGNHQLVTLDEVMISRRAKRLIRCVNHRDAAPND
ncbi:4-alpha-glucanotransferase [Yimella sp. cx-573]|nr:4-alpha-glucanotransferase [Yimella sp. cx-573]